MKREDLKAMGLTDEQVNIIMTQNGQDIENAKQNAAATEKARADGLQNQLDTLTTDLENARKDAGNLKDMQNKLDAANAKVKAFQRSTAIHDDLAQYKPRDVKVLAKLLDNDKITIAEDGTISGLKEQVESLKQTNAYLFADAPDNQGGTPPGGDAGGKFDMNAFLRG